MRAEDLLILRQEQFSERRKDFFKRMNESPAFQQLFIRDPAGTVANTLLLDFLQASPAKLNQANRLLYALLTNQGFMEWARRFQRELDEEATRGASTKDPLEARREHLVTVDRRKLYLRLLEGIRENLDTEMLSSLLGTNVESLRRGATRYEEEVGYGEEPEAIITMAFFLIGVVAVAVHILLTIVDFTPFVPEPGERLTREDLERVANVISEGMKKYGNELRQDGSLISST